MESYTLPQGKIIISHSDKNISIGFLELNPGQSLDIHNRPVEELLFQVKGTSVIKLNNENKILNQGDEIKIPANELHVHSNQSNEKSLTFWMFKGDIIEVINKIRGV